VQPEIYLVAGDLPGRLFIMPCPSGTELKRDVDAYRVRGVDTLLSMLAVDEAAQLGLSDEQAVCEDAGITFVSFPIIDFGLPDPDLFVALIQRIVDLLRAGDSVAVHCRAGIGRSGMVTAATLIALGYEVSKAVARVSASRGVSIPDTAEQGKFLAEFAQRKTESYS
jgi:protein-tyrosine phosphatase